MVKKLLIMLVLVASSAQGEIYAWRDSKGTTHYTNSMVEIPARYKAKAKVLNLGPEQKDQPSNQPVPSSAPAAAPAAPGAGAQLQVAPPGPPTVAVPARTQREERRRGTRRSRSTIEEE
ncbi:protein of unknown function, DUF4124-containing [Geotalea daltonii FRC-32]|uniref:DUF4124 domain-containing protein n=1 Tax=Geotalea daltonii (strain DSM 22248 / JCM 15807 / FRC-32) TaxID=316067 RepID=B9M6B0_GEODF|nr:DUF4124 domain-containing protein [Geotalea daltonii]ACM21898.1 protein of unknown function, DUF4124-containing [Geotalea daltonii FRC-32]